MGVYFMQVLAPQYLKKFHCIGSQCEETCCSNWRVCVDKPTHQKYVNLADNKLRSLITANLVRLPGNDNVNFSYIQLTSEGHCPFMSDDKLCIIQSKYDHTYLSGICNIYPRSLYQVNNTMEISATISCPEIARLILGDKEPIQFEYGKFGDFINGQFFYSRLETDKYQNSWRFNVLEIRKAAITILQNRSYSLVDRLLLLGLLCQKIQECSDNSQDKLIPELITKYERIMETGNARNITESVETNIAFQYKLLKEMYELRLFEGIIEASEEKLAEEIASYEKRYAEYYQPFMVDKEYIFENYLVNYMFRTVFPFSEHFQSIFDVYTVLIIHYAMIKFGLIEITGADKLLR